MLELSIPPSLVEQARQMGVNIDPRVTYDAQDSLVKLHQQYGGIDPEFGEEDCGFSEDSEFGSFLRHIIGRKADRAVRKVGAKAIKTVGKVAKTAVKVGAIASFVVPGVGPLVGGSALAAMGAADKLLGGTKKKVSAQMVSNTKALAALGDPGARRGVAVLATVAQIRRQKGVLPGKKAIPTPRPVRVMRYQKVVPKTHAQALALQKIQADKAKALAAKNAPKVAPKVVPKPMVAVRPVVQVRVMIKKPKSIPRRVGEFLHVIKKTPDVLVPAPAATKAA